MNLARVLLKLRYDRPADLACKLADRWWRPRVSRRRRTRWTTADLPARPEHTPKEFSPSAAQRLWPGAADRSWLADAQRRWPEWHAAAHQRAAAAAAGRFDLLNSGEVSVLDAAGRIRWHDDFKTNVTFPAECLCLDVPIVMPQEGSDIKVPWELSRFQHVFAFLWTDPAGYRDAFLRQWEDWLSANPVARGVNWVCTMDVALRAVSWTAACAAWGDTFDDATRRKMWAALVNHGHFIRDNLEWGFGPRTNHYFSDIVGLAVLGAALAPYPSASAWAEFAARELELEIRRQFAPDGFNCECSTTYHRLMVELATLGFLACRASGHDLTGAAHARLIAATRAIAVLADVAGHVPLIGDNDSGRVFPLVERSDAQMVHLLPLGATVLGVEDLAIGAAPPEVALLCGPAALASYACCSPGPGRAAGRALPDSGLYVLGCAADQMTIRCGPLTYGPVGSHAHLDQLSLTLSVDGRAFLVDPGQYCYTPSLAQRLDFIDSRCHNTVTVDDQPQGRMFPLGRMTYSIIQETRPVCLLWEVSDQQARWVGRHRGYRRLPGGAVHEREVVFDARRRVWTIHDRLPLAGRHCVEWRFHLHPDVTVERQDTVWRLEHGGRAVVLRWVERVAPSGRIADGWHAPAYGRRVPTRVVVFRDDTNGPVERAFVLQVEERRT